MNIKKILNLKKRIITKKVSISHALEELSRLINHSNIKNVDEIKFYNIELNRLKRVKEQKVKLLEQTYNLNENTDQIKEFLALDDQDLIKIKSFGYKMLE